MERIGSIVTPGEQIGLTTEFTVGPGTYESRCGKFVVASVVGLTHRGKSIPGINGPKIQLCVGIPNQKDSNILPKTSDEVTAVVTKVNTRYATTDILCVSDKVVKEKFQGIVRQQDVRSHNIDAVEIYSSFRPGDIIKAEIISLGNQRSYYLSTSKNHLGVILAESSAGHIMVPISWEQMQCPVTKAKEHRKVAKVEKV
uniref:Nucleic acid-binding, OB-fold-like protein isoform 1 n=1 Tax=Hirondellea gigas TaxID=1518452 RepID=A0A6A7GA45_9CRUS